VIVTMMVELLATRVQVPAPQRVAAAVRGHGAVARRVREVVAVTVATATQVAFDAVLVAETHTLSPTMRPVCRWCRGHRVPERAKLAVVIISGMPKARLLPLETLAR